jgi:hypothetical protein
MKAIYRGILDGHTTETEIDILKFDADTDLINKTGMCTAVFPGGTYRTMLKHDTGEVFFYEKSIKEKKDNVDYYTDKMFKAVYENVPTNIVRSCIKDLLTKFKEEIKNEFDLWNTPVRPVRLNIGGIKKPKHPSHVLKFKLHDNEYEKDGSTYLRVGEVMLIPSRFMQQSALYMGGLLITYVGVNSSDYCIGNFVDDDDFLSSDVPPNYYFMLTTIAAYKQEKQLYKNKYIIFNETN